VCVRYVVCMMSELWNEERKNDANADAADVDDDIDALVDGG
jgi:hypothetical protein